MPFRSLDTNSLRRGLLPVLFVGAAAFLVAHSVNAVVEDSLVQAAYPAKPASANGSPELDSTATGTANQVFVQEILSAGLFRLPPPPKTLRADGTPDEAAPVAPPLEVAKKVTLIGVVMGLPGNERAILEDIANRKQTLYQVSQRIPEVGEIVAIEKQRVLFRQGSQQEWLDLAIVKQEAAMVPLPRLYQPVVERIQAAPTQAATPVRRVLDRAQLAQLVSDPQAFLTEARFQPHFAGNGKLVGFKVDGIRQVGVLEKVGLLNEDVLSGINGLEIRDPARLWDVFRQLQNERSVLLSVVRQNQPVTLTADIR